MKKTQQRIAIYGGAFDPIHYGHIKTAKALQETFHFDKFLFIPSKTALLKESSKATATQRVEMLKLAFEDEPLFEIDQREIRRDSPSYTVETLKSLKQDHPSAQLNLILGIDAFAKLPQWHEWESLLKLSNLIVMHRPNEKNNPLPPQLQSLLSHTEVKTVDDLINKESGSILRIHAGDYPISSTTIRTMIKGGEDLRDRLPKAVKDYIVKNKLYS